MLFSRLFLLWSSTLPLMTQRQDYFLRSYLIKSYKVCGMLIEIKASWTVRQSFIWTMSVLICLKRRKTGKGLAG